MIQELQNLIKPAPRCCRKGCTQWAAFLPVLRIPAKGCPIPEHEPIAAVIELPLCDQHSNSMSAGEFVTKPMKKKLRELCHTLGRAEPDFGRAFVQRKPLGQDIQ
jgi:hypothetical protein